MTGHDCVGASATGQNQLYVKYKSVCNPLILQLKRNIE